MVWFVRHAQSVWNEAGLVQGQSEAPGLTDAGRAQAAQLAEQLADCGAGVVMSSDLRRAMETAQPIAHRLSVPLVADRTLRERALGDAEGRPVELLTPAVSGHDWKTVVDPDARPAGGESMRELYERVALRLGEFRRSPHAAAMVVVTHGGFLRTAKACLDGTPVASMVWPDQPNASVWRVDFGAVSQIGG